MEVATRKSFSVDGFVPYAEAVAALAKLEAQLDEVIRGAPELTESLRKAEEQAIMAEATALVNGGDQRTVKATKQRVDEIRARLLEVDHKRAVFQEAVRQQQRKVAELLPTARAQVQKEARSAHGPIVDRMIEALRAYADAAKEHEDLVGQVVRAMGGGLYGTLIQPNAPDAASILRIVAGIEAMRREAGYE